MTTNHAVMWLDHDEAHIIHFTLDQSSIEVVQLPSTRPHLHIKSGNSGSGRTPESAFYFENIVNVLDDVLEILLMGPGHAKDEFMKYVAAHHHLISTKIIATLTADHPTDPQLLAFARRYFVKIDRMNEDPVETLRHRD